MTGTGTVTATPSGEVLNDYCQFYPYNTFGWYQYPTYVPDNTRVAALELENAALKAKMDTLQAMVAALVAGSKNELP